jgi:hypothetical protein
MTTERERFRYVFVADRAFTSQSYHGPLWPPPGTIAMDGTLWRLVTASVLTDADLRVLRRAGRRVPERAGSYRAIARGLPLACGHALAFNGCCTICTEIGCDACPHPAHLGGCACGCDTQIQP